MTLDDLIINLGQEEFTIGLAYTALSRGRSLDRIAFEPMPGFKRLTGFFKRMKFLQRLEEDKRLLQLQEETLQRIEQQKIIDEQQAIIDDNEFLQMVEAMETD